MSNIHNFYIQKNIDKNSQIVANKLTNYLLKHHWKLNSKNYEYLFVIGGDGTYVRFLRNCYNKPIKIVCINSGTIGFYAKFNQTQINSILKEVLNPNNFIHPQLLQINIDNQKIYNAMNEVVVQSLNTVKLDVYINKTLYENYMGTGILVSTRTGATGQAKSNGGAIIMPNVDVMELVELSPTNHTKHLSFNSPLIVNGTDTTITLNNFKSAQRCDLIIDGMRVMTIKPNQNISITKVNSIFSLCFNCDLKNYIDKLQKTFIKQ